MDNPDVQYPVCRVQLRLAVAKGVVRYQYICLPVCRVSPISWQKQAKKESVEIFWFCLQIVHTFLVIPDQTCSQIVTDVAAAGARQRAAVAAADI